MNSEQVLPFEKVTRADVALVGGKNASLGELIGALSSKGVKVPPGFATTAHAYREFLEFNDLEAVIAGHLARYKAGEASLAQAGEAIRQAILAGRWPQDTEQAIRAAYRGLCRDAGVNALDVAARSSATAEDLPDASFAGQQETFLNIRGEEALLVACRRCFASLYTDRAISYREAQGFAEGAVALSVGVQRMIRADRAGSGVMFSIDTESGFDKVVLINAAWGLGESVVQGSVDPDEYQVFKPLLDEAGVRPIVAKICSGKQTKLIYGNGEGAPTEYVPTSRREQASFVLDDDEILQLARWAVIIERHYGCAMDMEWAKDGPHGGLFIVQARPETVQSRSAAGMLSSYTLKQKGEVLLQGSAIGGAIASGPVCLIESAADIAQFIDGSVLVTPTTDPDWVPIMKRAAAIITDHGGRTSHAAIVSRELGLPAIVGATGASEILHDRQNVTISCAEGDRGFVYDGLLDFAVEQIDFASLPATRTQVMLNLANPAAAYRWWQLPADGVGLTRMEFVISNAIKVHPMALVRFDQLPDDEDKAAIAQLTQGYEDKTEYFVDRLALGLARIAAVQFPRPVIIRMSDFKTNEYAGLLGGRTFEPLEENPMIGFRGASRYYSPRYREGFALECRAIRRLRNEMGFTNVIVMIPFCRSVEEADKVLQVMAAEGLRRGEHGLEVYVMCEIPSNVVLAGAFASRFDGFSIGSNDLTQLTLGIDRDSELLADQFDEQDAAVKWMIRHVIDEAHRPGAKVGLCGQAPSDHPEFARFLVECGIDSISVTPDSFVAVKHHVAAAEADG
ncbi:phosphoenolpyruvate synthase [Alteraurantiacibacter aestuarii]|uniref:phosphoenolpyruvate synthase n=1 Tax=Alteraurantiacibacter aestuarii TaxID=650004 RepID=UPI0031D5D445